MRTDRHRRDGFTLIETMITFVVASIGVLALLVMQIQALKHGSQARHRTGASMIARDETERIQNMPFSDTDLDVMNPVVWATPPWLANTTNPALGPGEVAVNVTLDGGTVQELVYTVWYLVTEDDPLAPNDDLRRVDLEVVWSEAGITNNRPTRTGQPTVALSTMLADNDK